VQRGRGLGLDLGLRLVDGVDVRIIPVSTSYVKFTGIQPRNDGEAGYLQARH